jgi:hypothetical protein
MKRCSTCNRTYTDPNLSFCIDDGTPLTTVDPQEESTVVSPRGNEPAAPAAYQPPSYVPPAGAAPRRRRMWPWVVGLLGAFILGIVAISIAAAIFAPRLLRSRENERPVAANTNRSENTNATEPVNSNVNPNIDVNIDTPPPTDHEQVLSQLTNLEQEWTVANMRADKEKLEQILADDFVGKETDTGALYTKADYLRTIQPNNEVEKWEFSDLNLLLIGDRATLVGTIKYESRGRETVDVFKDKFVWRDGRWQATGSEVTQRE